MDKSSSGNARFLLEDDEQIKNVRKIHLSELKTFISSPGDIFWKKKNGKLVCVTKVGELVDTDFLSKYKDKENCLTINWISDWESFKEAAEYFEGWSQAQSERVRVAYRRKILLWCKKRYWDSNDHGRIIDFLLLCQKYLTKDRAPMRQHFQILDVSYFKEASFRGGLAVLMALSLGYLDFNFISDFYQLFFFLDESLWLYDYRAFDKIKNAQEKGETFDSLTNISQSLIEKYKQHPLESSKIVQEKWEHLFHDPSLIKLIRRHHERTQGQGHPAGLGQNEISDIEAIMLFSAQGIPWEEEGLRNISKKYLFNLIVGQKGSPFLSERLQQLVQLSFLELKEEEEKKKFQELHQEAA